MKPAVSVVIPAHNEEKNISKCLESLMHQSEKPDEIIVVNNNSTDRTAEIASKFPGVRVINETKKGITYARTRGFNEAKYEIIARTDADTIVSRDWVKTIKDYFSTHPKTYGIQGVSATLELSPGNTFWFKWVGILLRKLGDSHVGVGRRIMFGHNMAIRKEAWDKTAKYMHMDESQVNEDVDLSLFVMRVGDIDFCPDLLVKTNLFGMIFNLKKIKRYLKTDKITVQLHKKLDKTIGFGRKIGTKN